MRSHREASLIHFLHKLKKKNVFNENVYDKFYLSGFAPARIMALLKCT